MNLRVVLDTWKILPRYWRTFVRGSFIGFWMGFKPGGATPASFMSYAFAKRFSKHPERFGKGELEGVVAPETAAHAAGVAAMLPMITLGIPGSPTAAVMLGGLIIWGLQPGPMLFKEKPDFVWGLIASMYTGNVIGVLMVLAFVPFFAAILRIPFAILTPLIVVVCAIGAYAVHNSMIDIWYMLIFGVVGYVFKKLDYPLAPLVLALVLGDLAENALRQSLIMSQGSLAIFVIAAHRRRHHRARPLLLRPAVLTPWWRDARGAGEPRPRAPGTSRWRARSHRDAMTRATPPATRTDRARSRHGPGAHQVDAHLRGDRPPGQAMIGEGRLKSGDRLPPERELAEKFVVSRTSVREALRALESLGLVEIRPGEGTFVREVSVDAPRRAAGPGDGVAARGHRRAVRGPPAARAGHRRPRRRAAPRPTRSRRWSGSSRSRRRRSPPGGRGSRRTPRSTPPSARAAHNRAITRIAHAVMDLLTQSREESLNTPGRPTRSHEDHRRVLAGDRARATRRPPSRRCSTTSWRWRRSCSAPRRATRRAGRRTLDARSARARILSPTMKRVDVAGAVAGTDYPGAAGPARSIRELDAAGCHGQDEARG